MIATEKKSALNKKNLILFGVLGVTICLIVGLSVGIVLSTRKNDLQRAVTLLTAHPLVDGHNDIASMIRKNFENRFDKFNFTDLAPLKESLLGTNGVTHTDIKRLKEGKLGAQFWAAYASCESLAKDAPRIHLEQLDVIKRLINKFPDQLEYVTTSEGITSAFKNKKVASLIGLESGHAIDSSMAMLRNFYRLGIRYMTLTHNCDVPWASNNLVDRFENASLYGGLTDFGRKIITEMNRMGMIIDISHTSHQTQLDVLASSKAPVMFSHSSVHKLCDHPRNVRDDVLQKLKENRGVIMINFYTGFINCKVDSNKANLDQVIEHIEYVKNLIGVDYIGIGSDYDGVPTVPEGLEDVSKFPNLVARLIKKGWSESDINKVIGANIIRVFSDVEKYSQSVSSMAPLNDLLVRDPESSKCFSQFKNII